MLTLRIAPTACRRSAFVASLVLAAGACASCTETQTRTTQGDLYRPYRPSETTPAGSVNTGLASLSAEKPTPTLIPTDAPESGPAPQTDRVAESARMLDEYFGKLSQGTPAQRVAPAAEPEVSAGGYDPSAELGPTGSSQLVVAADDAEPFNAGLAQLEDDPAVDLIEAPGRTLAQADATPATIRIEDAPAMPGGQGGTPLGATRVVDRPVAQGPTASPGTNTTMNPGTARPAQPEVRPIPTRTGEDPALAAIESELNAPATGHLTGVPVGQRDDSVVVASADGEMTKLPPSPEQRKQQLVDELVSVLNELAAASDEPFRQGLALAGLETLSPGALYQLTESGVLMPDEVRTLLAAHEMFSGMSADGGVADAGRVSDLLRDVKEKLDEHAPLVIPAAELCTRVLGYGQYDMFPKAPDGSYAFQAGRRQPIIIYTEVDRFGRRPKVGEDGLPRWEVTLSQELQIYHEADDLLVMARKAETDRSVSRNKIRDYYLINQTYLPETLGVGRYNLKVIMQDENKQAIAERIIPITIVPAGSLPTP